MNSRQEPDFPVTRKTLQIALRRARAGRVRCLIGGEIVDHGRPVPGYVASALLVLLGTDNVRLADYAAGSARFEITPTGLNLHDELTSPKKPTQRKDSHMTTSHARANVWVTIPEDCRFESAIIAADDVRMVIGHPAEDGLTLEANKEALRRLHAVIGNTLNSLDDGSWENSRAVWISDPATYRN